MESGRQAVHRAGLYFGAQAFPMAARLVAVVVIIRVLEPAELGITIVGQSIGAFSALVLGGWSQQYYIRAVAAYGENAGVWRHHDRVTLLSSVAVAVIGLPCVVLLSWYGRIPIGLSAATIAIIAARLPFESYTTGLQAHGEATRLLLSRFLQGTVYLGLIAAMAASGLLTPEMALFGEAGSFLLASLPARRSFARAVMHVELVAPSALAVPIKHYLRGAAAYGFPLVIWFAISGSLEWVDRWLVLALGGAKLVGVYGAAYSIAASAVALGLGSIFLWLHPTLIRELLGTAAPEASRRLGRLLWYLGAVCAAGIIAVPVCQKYLLEPVVGIQYRIGGPSLVILVAAFAFWNVGQYVHKPLEVAGKTKTLAMIAIFSLLVDGVLCIVLVPVFGLLGAASAVLASRVAYAVVAAFLPGLPFSVRAPFLGATGMMLIGILVSVVFSSLLL